MTSLTIAAFDHLETGKKKELLTQCCGSGVWVSKMLAAPLADDLVELLEYAEEKWYECSEDDWREAFEHHPKIGDINSLKKKFENTAEWAAGEQSGVNTAADETLSALAQGNEAYEKKFGYIFIVCATGKSAGEMLQLLEARINNHPAEEINIAADEQNKITRIRLEKLFLS